MGILFETLRYERKLSRETVSEIVGISDKTLQNIERGKTEPRLETVARLCDLYHISFDELKRFYTRDSVMDYEMKIFQITDDSPQDKD